MLRSMTLIAAVLLAPLSPVTSASESAESFNGQGMFLTFQVVDAKAEYERLEHAGLTIAYPIAYEAWGQRRFGLYDPSGTWVDVVQQIEPAKGYWDKYMSPGVTSE